MRALGPATALLALVALLAAVPAAAAAEGDLLVDVAPPAAPLLPLSETANLTGEIRVPCRLLHEAGNGTAAAAVDLALHAPRTAEAEIVPARLQIGHRDACGADGYATAPFGLLVKFKSQALALQPQPFAIHATLAGGTENATGEGRVEAQPAYYAVLNARTDTPVVTVHPGGTANIPILVENHGNGDTRVRFTLTKQPDALNVVSPPPVTLASNAAGADESLTRANITLAVQAPDGGGFVNNVYSLTLEANGTYAYQPGLRSDHNTMSILVTVKGFGAPAPAAALIALTLAGAALILRRPPP